MFILTVIFLIGMIFALQQVFLQYAFFDLPETARDTPQYLMAGLERGLNTSVQSAGDCVGMQRTVDELKATAEQQLIGGFSVQLDTQLNCTSFAQKNQVYPALITRVALKERAAETIKTVQLFKG